MKSKIQLNFKMTFHISPEILRQCADIERISRYLIYIMKQKPLHKLYIATQFKLLASLLSMEDKGLKMRTLKAILKGNKRGTQQDFQEFSNINKVASNIGKWNPLSITHFKQAHAILMKNLDENSGHWRKEQVLVFEGKRTVHIPPYPQFINESMLNLFDYLNKNVETPRIIEACIMHYAVQFIHPFFDGNGRMGRLWQHLLFIKYNPIFNYILIGDLICNDQKGYYRSLDKSDLTKNGTIFIQYCLLKISNELRKLATLMKLKSLKTGARFFEAWLCMKKKAYILEEYLKFHPNISLATARKDIAWGKKSCCTRAC